VPRYDLPRAAPEPLRLVQRIVNTADREHGHEWLCSAQDLAALLGCDVSQSDVERARSLREALRQLLLANNGEPLETDAIATFNAAAGALGLRVDDRGQLEITSKDALGRIVAIAVEAMLDGTWPRLKACRNCGWAFYDSSKNRSASWCSMRLCGNRLKTRAYRSRKARR
jgi:predicted RNA-binding Zn ribbon-like protein